MSSFLLGAALLLSQGSQMSVEATPNSVNMCAPLIQEGIQNLYCVVNQPEKDNGPYTRRLAEKSSTENPFLIDQEQLCSGKFSIPTVKNKSKEFGINYQESAKVFYCGPKLHMRVLF
jgi:hypothetical protein